MNYNLYHKWIYNLQNKWFTIGARHGGIFKPVRTPWVVWFLASIKCICIVEFCLSFYFSYHLQYSTLFCRILSHFVEWCRCVYCIHYYCIHVYNILFIMYTIYLLKCIQYFFIIHLTKYINYVLRTLFPITYIPYICNYKHIKK